MATYECTIAAKTWLAFAGGELSGSAVPISIGTKVQGRELTEKQALSGDTIIQIVDGRFTKRKWFDVLVADSPTTPPPPPPTPLPVTSNKHVLEVVEDSAGNTVSVKYSRNGILVFEK